MKQTNQLKYLLVGLSLVFSIKASCQFQSSILHYNDSLRLVYHSDKDGNRIPDFSYAGYKNGEAELPELPVVLEISPISGDNTAHIQAAIDSVSSLELDSNGHRGALLLNPGLYPIHGIIYLGSSGVVLRGSGESADSTGTILQGIGNTPHQRKLIVIGGNKKTKWSDEVPGSRINITSEYVPAGSRTFEVSDASKYTIGDNIIIRHPSTSKWLAAVDYGGTAGDVLWKPGQIDMYFNRFITRIEGNKIQVDVPIYHELDRSLSQAYAWIFTRSKLVTESGIENLRIEIQTSGPEDEDHVWSGINFVRVEDCWAINVSVLYFGYAGFFFEDATRSTVMDCSALEPKSKITGSRRYNFNLGSACNNILFKNCHASESRHAFVSNGTSTVSGIVFTSCSTVDDHTASESHRRWGQALLYDKNSHNSKNTTRVLGLYNRGDYGTGHGWTGTHQVAWNVSAPNNQIVIQKPPIGQNYGIGCDATVDNKGPFPNPVGYIEGTGENITPESLYEAQLLERLTYGLVPDAPGRLTETDYSFTDNSGYVNLEWIDISLDENQYVLERSTDGGTSFEKLAHLGENIESYSDTNILQDNYHYRIKAVNEIGSSPWSNLLHVELSITAGLSSPEDQHEIIVFPNPFTDLLTVKSSISIQNIVLYDAVGRVVKHVIANKKGEVLINVKDLSNGIYFIALYSDNDRIAFNKIVKNMIIGQSGP
ncbi:MAG TPA: T9SS type A sorting domain-containing protein [Bacteroides sp.]|nr:T9SS type A sorting domain-containing protein [Bacteroides sp.]